MHAMNFAPSSFIICIALRAIQLSGQAELEPLVRQHCSALESYQLQNDKFHAAPH
jgi:hypothetical protein